MTAPEVENGAAIEAASNAGVARAAAPVLHGNEIIEFSIKPSLWYVVILSTRTVVVTTLFAAAIWMMNADSWGLGAAIVFQASLAVAVLRVAIATLQWASRVYILTNCRVMTIKGVWRVTMIDCPLSKISAAKLRVAPYQMLLRIGSLRMTPCDEKFNALNWKHVSRPDEITRKVERAIREAQSR